MSSTQADDMRIAAASNLRYVLPQLTEIFEERTGKTIAITYAATGTLATQIEHGAPFDLFLSAHPEYVQHLVSQGFSQGDVVNFAQSHLALFRANHSKLATTNDLEGLKIALLQGQLNKVVIANPRHAPYGLAAKKLLIQQGLWESIQSHFLIAENASQAIQFALISQVDAGFVPYSYAFQPNIASRGHFIKMDMMLQQQAVVLSGASQTASEFLTFIQSTVAVTVLKRNGFSVEAIQ